MQSPREISSENQGALTPATAHLVSKAAVELPESGATPRALDPTAARTPWANLSIDTATTFHASSTPSPSTGDHLQSGDVMPTAAVSQVARAASSMRSGSGSSQVSLPAGLLPERYTADLTHWQSPADLPERRLMVQRIIAMTRSKRVDAAHCIDTRTPSLAKRIELSLYSRAASFHEYRDLNTLRRRLQSLVSLSFHEAAVSRRRAAAQMANGIMTAAPQLGKRKCRAMTPFGVSRLTIKRPRAECIGSTSTSTPRTNERLNQEASFFLMDEAVLGLVFEFLPGVETVRCMALNRFAHRVLPRCVFTLDLDLRQLQLAYKLHAASVPTRPAATLLCQFPNLTRLTVFNSKKPLCDQQEAGPALHAWGCSELDISHDNAGEEVVQQLAEGIELGACRRLTSLRLVSVFTNTCRGNALHLLCAALVKGSCPDLEDLLLGGNGFSDVGTVDVAWLLKVGSLPKLARLDIRRNYIGESGLKRIMAALHAGRCQQLKYLCMGGNIITDNSVAPVVELLSSAMCPQMRFLGLEDNFLSARGVQCIIQAAVAGGMMPKLHHVSCDGSLGTDNNNVRAMDDTMRVADNNVRAA
ncbi:tyrosine-protein phosphatase required for protection against superoxide stress (By similarity) [Phytophthora boehmeriae]|uniref:Tyrosine-protein phosphatase required for protection against superoxide stress By similarity n=1 Tax=Phytophthora boehmeriae TaxID=109152 RepID=A0A8T1WDP0_9STRA|nr:tyrosine-protein phosphatase required for protection against superoxide stress (By similarity) [Phytophthora boehmeriae]